MPDNIETSKTGKWVDNETGKVVTSEPAEGRLLVAPGNAITPDVKASIERAEAAARNENDPDGSVETATADDATETATVESRSTRRTPK
jgi:hypothetical protein